MKILKKIYFSTSQLHESANPVKDAREIIMDFTSRFTAAKDVCTLHHISQQPSILQRHRTLAAVPESIHDAVVKTIIKTK
jgi:hypothetical protein